MKKIICEVFAMQVVNDNEEYYIRYDSGESCSQLMEIPITKEEAEEIALLTNMDAASQYFNKFIGVRTDQAVRVNHGDGSLGSGTP